MPDATHEPGEVSGEGRGRLIDFPREREPGLVTQNNLPLQLTSFVGREREVADLEKLLAGDDVRLPTLTGPGGAVRHAWHYLRHPGRWEGSRTACGGWSSHRSQIPPSYRRRWTRR
jgi:hypothetical protein